MSIDEKTDKPAAAEPASTDATPAAGTRRRIVRSASTRASEAAEAEAAAAKAAAAPAADAPAPAPAAKPAAPAEHTPKRFDVRAAKPAPSADRPRPARTDGPRKPWEPRNDGRPDASRPPRRDGRPGGRGPRPPRAEDHKPITWTDAHPATRAEAKPAAPGTDAPRPRAADAPKAAPPKRVEAPKAAKPAAPPPPPPKPAKPAAQPILALPGKARVAPQPAAKPAPTAKEALAAKTARLAQANAQAKAKASDRPAAAAPADFTADELAAGFEAAVAALKAVGERGVALVDAWTTGSNAAALVAVADASDVASAPRKAARRGINVLKARGVEIPAAPRVARVSDAAPTVVEAMFQPPDPTGAVSFSITSREAGGRFHIAEVIAREPAGILQAAGGWLSGTQLREGRARAASSLGVAPVPVPVEWARHRIAKLRQQNATSGQIVPLGFDACRDLVEPAPESEPAHPLAELDAAITTEKAWALAPASRSLHDEPEFRSWLPDRGAVDELLAKLGERLGPEGVKDSEKVNDAMREEIDSATDRFFSPEIRAVVASRMRDAAISVRARRGDERATEVLGAAKAVVEAGLITSPPREIPFLVAFFQKAIGFLAQQGALRVPVRGPEPTETPAAT